MNNKQLRHYIVLLTILFLAGCEGPEPRRPIGTKNLSSIQASVARGKALLAQEEKRMLEIITIDSLHHYEHSASGSWYYYQTKNDRGDYTPLPDDLVTLTYNIVGFENDTIYTQEEIGVLQYKVDKQELFPGMRHSVKLLKEHETATFLYPSSMAFGYHGDGAKIGVNVPLKSTVTILKVEKQEDNADNQEN
tara:strand:+ start:1314 stop:1889 length:576 start_codon:yes stop_codon:yes gene_type:complete